MTAVARDPATTVLVVEDEESFVEALTIGLKREGFRVEVARDGVEALDRFDAIHPDLVLLDVMLPTVSGIEVCRQIRAHSPVPIIMVSARTSEIDVVVGLEVGADDYVSKPYRMRELVARIRATMRRTPLRDPRSAPTVMEVGRVRLDPERHEVLRQRQAGQAAPQGVRAARSTDGQRGAGAHPGRFDRPGLGAVLRRRHQNPRRPRQTAPREDRSGSEVAIVDRHHPRPRLQVRAALIG